MSGTESSNRGTTWRTPLRLALRFGFLLAGVAVVGYWIVASVGGDISRPGFALGILLILASGLARFVPGR